MLYLFGTFSLLVGSISLSIQFQLKRFLAYSSISNIGFLLLGYANTSIDLFYLFVYLSTILVLFMLLIAIGATTLKHIENLIDLGGIYRNSPTIALVISLILFSLAGAPPLGGFFAKLYILLNLLILGSFSMALIAILSSVLSASNYLNLINITNLRGAQTNHRISIVIQPATLAALLTFGVLILLMGVTSMESIWGGST